MRLRFILCLLWLAVGPSRTVFADATTETSSAVLTEDAVGVRGARTFDGSTKWTYGDRPDVGPVVKADVRVPRRGLRLRIVIHRNIDRSLPAAQLIEVNAETGAGFPADGITSISGISMKRAEAAFGQPLIGASVKVTGNLFWIALSNAREDVQANLFLLRQREWLALSIVYASGQTATLAFQKGLPGSGAILNAAIVWARDLPSDEAVIHPASAADARRRSVFSSVSPPSFESSH